jgi:hypothetical protein
MVRLRGIHVSGNHAVQHEGRWVPAADHPEAVPAPELSRILCLGTSNNRIPVVCVGGGVLEFTDYEETEDEGVVAEAQAAAEAALGMPADAPPVADYGLGLDPQFEVIMMNGRRKLLEDVVVGDYLAGGGRVRGVIREECEHCLVIPGGRLISGAQLIGLSRGWQRAARAWPDRRVTGRRVLCQLMLEDGPAFQVQDMDGLTYRVRDYTEVPGGATQAPYDRYLGVTTG